MSLASFSRSSRSRGLSVFLLVLAFFLLSSPALAHVASLTNLFPLPRSPTAPPLTGSLTAPPLTATLRPTSSWQFSATSRGDEGRWRYKGILTFALGEEEGEGKGEGEIFMAGRLVEQDERTGSSRTLVFEEERSIEKVHVRLNGYEQDFAWRCTKAEGVPPLSELIDALKSALPLPRSSLSSSAAAECADAPHLFAATFTGRHYVICAWKDLVRVIGEEFQASLTPTPRPAPPPTRLETSLLRTCAPSAYRNHVPTHVEAPLLNAAAWFTPPLPSLKRAVEKKACIFLHGSGEKPAAPPTTTFRGYWGALDTLLQPICSSFAFIHADTVNNGWDNHTLQKYYCDLATADQGSQRHYIEDKYVFTHSMGNLILAGAFNNSICAKGKGTKWFSIAAPLLGSGVAGALKEICLRNGTGVWKEVARIVGACDANGIPTIAYQSLYPSRPQFRDVQPIFAALIDAQMCGTSSEGLTSIYSLPLYLIQAIADLAAPNDGLVELFSCQVPDRNWFATYQQDWYLSTLNHADLTCRDGNGWWGANRQPCSWFAART